MRTHCAKQLMLRRDANGCSESTTYCILNWCCTNTMNACLHCIWPHVELRGSPASGRVPLERRVSPQHLFPDFICMVAKLRYGFTVFSRPFVLVSYVVAQGMHSSRDRLLRMVRLKRWNEWPKISKCVPLRRFSNLRSLYGQPSLGFINQLGDFMVHKG